MSESGVPWLASASLESLTFVSDICLFRRKIEFLALTEFSLLALLHPLLLFSSVSFQVSVTFSVLEQIIGAGDSRPHAIFRAEITCFLYRTEFTVLILVASF